MNYNIYLGARNEKNIFILVFLCNSVFSSELIKTTVLSGNSSCLEEINITQGSYDKYFYKGFIVSDNLDKARKEAELYILKRINSQISYSAVSIYNNEIKTKNNVLIKEISYDNFLQKTNLSYSKINLGSIKSTEFQCYSGSDIYLLKVISKKDVYNYAINQLNLIISQNEKKLLEIDLVDNILKKNELFLSINYNILPLVLIVTMDDPKSKLSKHYLRELKMFSLKYNNFISNIIIYIKSDMDYNRVYSIEIDMEKVVDKIKKYFSEKSLDLIILSDLDTVDELAKKTKKNMALLSINLSKKTYDINHPVERYGNVPQHYKMTFNFFNTIKPKVNKLTLFSKVNVKFPDYEPMWNLNLLGTIDRFNKERGILNQLSKTEKFRMTSITETYVGRDKKTYYKYSCPPGIRNRGSKISRDDRTGQWAYSGWGMGEGTILNDIESSLSALEVANYLCD